MENRKKALGMGLEELFNSENLDLSKKKDYEDLQFEEIRELNLNELRPNPYQPRELFDEKTLGELTNSIKEHGVFQPIMVKKSIKGYEIIAGERRVRASKKAGLKTIPAIIRKFTDNEMMEIALLENLQRENLNAIEEAKAYQSFIDKLSLTHEELSKKVSKSRSHITNMLGLLKLPKEVQYMIIANKISMGHARVLSKFDNIEQIIQTANKIVEKKLPVRELEEIASDEKIERTNKITKRKSNTDSEFKYVEDLMNDVLDTKIKIKNNKIVINFNNVADLNRILEVLNIKER